MRNTLDMTVEIPAVLVTAHFFKKRQEDLQRTIAGRASLQLLREAEIPEAAALKNVRCAFLSTDLMRASNKQKPNEYLAAFGAAVASAPLLSWLHTCSSGSDRPMLQDAMHRGVVVTTSAGANSVAVAHSAIAGMLSLARGIPAWVRNQDVGHWASASAASAPRDIAGQHAVVVGLGHVGSEVARVCGALRMRVTGVRARAGLASEYCESVVTYDGLSSVLGKADWVFLCCPLTPATHGMASRSFLELLPPGASLVNVGRGELAVEEDVFDALQSGRLAGVYSDVFAQEPLPADSPWWKLRNVLLSPHVAGLSRGFAGRTEDMFLANLARWLDKLPLENVTAPAVAR